MLEDLPCCYHCKKSSTCPDFCENDPYSCMYCAWLLDTDNCYEKSPELFKKHEKRLEEYFKKN